MHLRSAACGVPGVMRLVPSDQHTPGSPWWRILHPDPGAAGGYSEWAIPAGAPRIEIVEISRERTESFCSRTCRQTRWAEAFGSRHWLAGCCVAKDGGPGPGSRVGSPFVTPRFGPYVGQS